MARRLGHPFSELPLYPKLQHNRLLWTAEARSGYHFVRDVVSALILIPVW